MNSKDLNKDLATSTPTQITDLIKYIKKTDLVPIPLPAEFFYPSLPLCIIDAVYSIGVKYTSTQNTVARFCDNHGWQQTPVLDRTVGDKTVSDLIECIRNLSSDEAADKLFGNRQRTSTRSGILKADAVLQFAKALNKVGINDFPDISENGLREAEKIVKTIPGQVSGISFDYFRMLAGDDQQIKPDRMVQRFVAKALGTVPEKIGTELARTVLQGAVKELNNESQLWTPRQLDYAIWLHERSQS